MLDYLHTQTAVEIAFHVTELRRELEQFRSNLRELGGKLDKLRDSQENTKYLSMCIGVFIYLIFSRLLLKG